LAATPTVGSNHALRVGVEIRRENLRIGLLSLDGTALLRIEGDLDAATAPTLLDIGRSLAGAGCHDIVLDCDGLHFCDSAGLHAFVSIRQAPGVASVTLARPRAMVRKLLAITGLAAVLDVTPPLTVASA
jgi:anti-sigma B factor antagonist